MIGISSTTPRRTVTEEDVAGYLRAREITLTCDPQTKTLQPDTPGAVTTVIRPPKPTPGRCYITTGSESVRDRAGC
jgi:hypothetical protein